MKISINIITKDRKFELERAIKSLIKEKIDGMEIVIIDNGSSDGTQEHIKKIIDFYKIDYTYYYSHINLGVSGGRNKALELSLGEYVFTIDDDAIVDTDDIFNKIISVMDSNKQIAAAALNIYEPISEKYLIGKIYSLRNDRIYNNARAFSFIGAAHILRKKFFEDNVLYPKNLMFGSEELYASLSVHKKDKVIAYFEDIKILHLPSNKLRVDGDKRKLDFILNNFIIKKLCFPIILHPLITIVLFIRLIRHRLYKFSRWSNIYKTYRTRYNPKEKNRLSIFVFFRLIKHVGIFYLL